MARSFCFQPHDVLFFRDGKPSSRGDDHFHRSIFPPHPSTLYGAIRTRRLLDCNVDLQRLSSRTWDELVGAELQEEIGTPDQFGTLSLRGPWLTRRGDSGDEVLLPAPYDLGITQRWQTTLERGQERKRRAVGLVARYRPREEAAGRWSHPFAPLTPFHRRDGQWIETGAEKDDLSPPHGWFVRARGMNAWLDGAAPAPDDFVHSSELWDEEIRTGVGLKSDNRTSEMSMLYTFAFVRLMPGVSIGFELSGEGLKLPADTSLKTPADISLGGEGRGGTLLDGPPMPVQSRAPRGRFSLYLATPAIFDNGCIPDSFDPASNHGSLAGVACRLIAPVCRGFDLIGGWDLAAGRPRPLRRALPAGTVLLFESTGAEAGTERPFMDPGLLKQGFGLSLVGSST